MIEDASTDLFDSDVYYDTSMIAILMVMNTDQMFSIYQPERAVTKSASFTWALGNEKNIRFVPPGGGTGTGVITLPTSSIPDGTVVRVYNDTGSAYVVGVKFGSGGLQINIANGKMGEYVYMGGQWRSVVHDQPFVD